MKSQTFRAVPVLAGALAGACLAAGQSRIPSPVESSQPIQMEQAARRAAEYESRLQDLRIRAFVEAWNAFIQEWTEKGTYNAKKARKVRKAWDDLDDTRLIPR